ncbi:amphiregulin [Acipenser ruthenus]|uniref:amphiregulin n=1 Tax=Acipenser ruthenus TaxID=7906 RepID=UPI00274093AA|nr:amphiregulin [Acipenser ruthenus]
MNRFIWTSLIFLVCLNRGISTELKKEDNEGLLLTTTNGTRNDFSSWDGFEDEEDDIENEREVSVSGDSLLGLDDDTVRVQPVAKPKESEGQDKRKKTGKRNNRQRNKDKNDKKKKLKANPCTTTHSEYCIHGECVHYGNLNETTCICNGGYSGERCGIQQLSSVIREDSIDVTQSVLVVIAVVLSLISFIAVLIIICVHCRSQKRITELYHGRNEEKEKLHQDKGNSHIVV